MWSANVMAYSGMYTAQPKKKSHTLKHVGPQLALMMALFRHIYFHAEFQ